MKRLVLLGLLALPLTSAVFAADAATASAKTTLSPQLSVVKALKLDEIVAIASKVGVGQAKDKGLLTQEQFDCVQFTSTDFEGPMADVVNAHLDSDEMTAALSFFQTDAGKKFAEILYKAAIAATENKELDPKSLPDMSAEDEKSFQDFYGSPAGKKILESQGFMQTQEGQAAIETVVGDAVVRCAAPRPAAEAK